MTPTLRETPTGMGCVNTNLTISPTLKVHKMILTLGPHRLIWIHYNYINSNVLNIPTDDANCKNTNGPKAQEQPIDGPKSPIQWILLEKLVGYWLISKLKLSTMKRDAK